MIRSVNILENVIPTSGWFAYSFPDCFSSLLMSRDKRIKPRSGSARIKRDSAYRSVMTASGLAFGNLYKKDFIPFRDIDYHLSVPDGGYIPYAMDHGRCRYHIIENIGVDEKEIREQIADSICRGVPVLAKRLAGPFWSLITGCEDSGATLYGYSCGTDRSYFPADGYTKNGMFFKTNWFGTLERIIVVDGFDAEEPEQTSFIRHWRSVMERRADDLYIYGVEALDAYMDLLNDDAFYDNADKETLSQAYNYVFTLSNISEARRQTGFIKNIKEYAGYPIGKLADNGFRIHELCWKYWASISARGIYSPDPDGYAYKLRDRGNRMKALKYLAMIRDIDRDSLEILRTITNDIAADSRET